MLMIDLEFEKARSAPPVMVPEFESIQRYGVRDSERYLAKIRPGEYYATAHGELISTTLGSCVAACIRNRATGIGGMNHFLLPDSFEGSSQSWEQTLVSAPARYGNVAMERLINVVLGNNARRKDLEIKVFGGAKVLRANIDIGERNSLFVKSYLRTEGLMIAAQDLGGTAPRKVIYDPVNGDVFVRKLGSRVKSRIVEEEFDHLKTIKDDQVSGDGDLFTMDDGWESP
jgi:chemotaxis protein CheD